MSLNIVKETGQTYNPVFQAILEDIPGGVTLRTSTLPTDLKFLQAGALLNADTTSVGLFNVVKVAKSLKTHTAVTAILVNPNHVFKAGDFVNKINGDTVGGTAATILSITHTGPSTDTIVIAAALGTLSTASMLYQTTTAAATTQKYAADSILRDTVKIHDFSAAVTSLKNISAGAVVRGTINEPASPYFYTNKDKTNLTARIRFANPR